MRKEKGITLIALIITIIVMIILVAVTVNVALNGGLFGKAETATNKTTREVEREKLISSIVGGIQNNGDFDITKVTLPKGAIWIKSKDDTTRVEQPNTSGNWVMAAKENTFFVDKHGNVLDDEPIIFVSFEPNTNLGKITLNTNLTNLDPNVYSEVTSEVGLKCKKNDDELSIVFLRFDDNSYAIGIINFDEDTDIDTEEFYNVYIYASTSLNNVSASGKTFSTPSSGWFQLNVETNEISELTDMPVFEGYSTGESFSSDIELLNELFANVFIKK